MEKGRILDALDALDHQRMYHKSIGASQGLEGNARYAYEWYRMQLHLIDERIKG